MAGRLASLGVVLIAASLGALPAGGEVRDHCQLTTASALVEPGEPVHVEGTGFPAGPVTVWLESFSTGALISLGPALATGGPGGSLDVDLPVPVGTTSGLHYLFAECPGTDHRSWGGDVFVLVADPRFTSDDVDGYWYVDGWKNAFGANCPTDDFSLADVGDRGGALLSLLPAGTPDSVVPGDPTVGPDGTIAFAPPSADGEHNIFAEVDDDSTWEAGFGLTHGSPPRFVVRGLCTTLLELTADGTALDPASLDRATFDSFEFEVGYGYPNAHCGMVIEPREIEIGGTVHVRAGGYFSETADFHIVGPGHPEPGALLGSVAVTPASEGNPWGELEARLPLPSSVTEPGTYQVTSVCHGFDGYEQAHGLEITVVASSAAADPAPAPPATPVAVPADLAG